MLFLDCSITSMWARAQPAFSPWKTLSVTHNIFGRSCPDRLIALSHPIHQDLLWISTWFRSKNVTQKTLHWFKISHHTEIMTCQFLPIPNFCCYWKSLVLCTTWLYLQLHWLLVCGISKAVFSQTFIFLKKKKTDLWKWVSCDEVSQFIPSSLLGNF